MPQISHTHYRTPNVFWGLWHITEAEENLKERLSPFLNTEELAPLKSELKRRQWLSCRLLLKNILAENHLKFEGTWKDECNKAHLVNSKTQISFSHSKNLACVAISNSQKVGIDIEQRSAKVQKVAAKFLSAEETKFSQTDLQKLTQIWCAKEAMYKWDGKKGLSFKEELLIQSFENETWQGVVKRDEKAYSLHLQLNQYEDFCIVIAH